MPQEAIERELERCCASKRWVAAMAARRPFKDANELYDAAEDIWWSLEGGDWLEAFSQHPRIGDRASGWAKDEQSSVAGASEKTLQTLAERNREYERRFEHVFLICATGKRAEEMIAALERRMEHDPATELRVAAGEQAKITQLRLEKLLASPPAKRSRSR